jgi:hypothetical protein
VSSSTERAALGPEVEQLQAPPSPCPAGWQENQFVIAWDTSHDTGFLTHVQRVPGRGEQEVRAVVVVDGTVASATLVGPYGPQLLDGLTIDVVEPFRRIRVGLRAGLAAGEGPLGLLTLTTGGDVPVAVDLQLESDLPVVDFAAGLDAIVGTLRDNAHGPQMGRQEHYEQGGRWRGTLRVGDREAAGEGLFVRDHSWGIRSEQQDFKAFWTASCLDGGNVFCNAIGIPTGDRIAGIGAVADADGVRFTRDVHARFRPAPGIGSYDSVDVHFGAGIDRTMQARTRRHVPIPLPHSGPGRCDNNAISSVLMEGKLGFGVMEWASTFTDAEAAAAGLRAGAGVGDQGD